MIADTNTGGPAFPAAKIISGDNYNPPTKVYHSGMTLRDYFAAKAMQGYFIAGVHHDDFNTCANSAYAMADAMMNAR